MQEDLNWFNEDSQHLVDQQAGHSNNNGGATEEVTNLQP